MSLINTLELYFRDSSSHKRVRLTDNRNIHHMFQTLSFCSFWNHTEFLSTWPVCSSHPFSQGRFHLFVPQTVDERIQHGDHHRVDHRHDFHMVRWAAWLSYDINKSDSPIKQSDCSKVGSAWREGLVPFFSRAHLQGRVEDV